ncbi:type 1 glutamine amidotransferase [uncultured Eubacterium sp.]|uniref:type 1 glutamine amidotransferase n=1 Tax=uncultured Eubacterium sp. TaxID=165185 RepID=UPI00345DD073
MAVKIVHLYPEEMNLYGDRGNVICLKKRLEARNYKVDVINVGLGERIPDFDILFIGGGQDKEMSIVRRDVRRKAEELTYYIHSGKTILAICGGYQLLGEYYKTSSSQVIELSGALPFFTEGAKQRMIGNIVFESPFGKIVGFENHSGKTYVANELRPLGRVISGYGNNGEDGSEGVLYKNTFGTYAHGAVLPKNPLLADEIIKRALQTNELSKLDDELENLCHNSLVSRFT